VTQTDKTANWAHVLPACTVSQRSSSSIKKDAAAGQTQLLPEPPNLGGSTKYFPQKTAGTNWCLFLIDIQTKGL
jgi:hypothetical protein